MRIRKTITIPKDLVTWAEKEVKRGKYPGVRSLSGFIEYLLRQEKEKCRKNFGNQKAYNEITKR